MNFFKQIDTFLNNCVDYYDYRIRTGKFIYDIKYYVDEITNFFTQLGNKLYSDTKESNLFFALLNLSKTLLQTIMKIKLLAIIVSFIIDTVKIVIAYYTEIFIIFAFTFPLTILLVNFFQTAIIAFFIGLIPILLLNIYCVSALYNYIKHREEGEKITLWQSFHMLVPRLSAIIYPALMESAIIQEAFFGFIVIALFMSYAFELTNVSWSSSFVFWFIVLFLLFVLIIGIFIISILMYQTYFTLLLENLPFRQAFKRSGTTVFTFFPYYFIFYLFIYSIFTFFIWKAAIAYLYIGVTIGLYCACIATTFLAFLLWKKFRLQSIPPVVASPQKPPFLITIIIIFSFLNYILLAIFLIKEYQPLTTFVQQQEDSFIASQEMKQYTNKTYDYTIKYPQTWSVYEWNSKSTTFYNNYTGTISGGTWMAVNVSLYNQQAFEQLWTADPGVVIENGITKVVTTKVTNMTIQGYDTVNYTLVKPEIPYPQFETHYLIHKGNLIYDIAFISLSNDVANYDNDLFQKIINSFQFTQ